MFCSSCGKEANGNFCCHCGQPLEKTEEILEVLPVVAVDWSQETRYETLIHIPEIRDLLAQSASNARKGITGEQFLALYDKVFSPPVSAKKVAEIVSPLYASWGIETGKRQAGHLPAPPGRVLVAVLCSLAQHGREIKKVHQCSDGCILHAALPSDLFSLEGELIVTVRRQGHGTHVEAATRIPGQLFDWGKSQRCLHKLFQELGAAA